MGLADISDAVFMGGDSEKLVGWDGNDLNVFFFLKQEAYFRRQ